MFIKLFYITGTFTHFSIIICINFLRVIFRIFCYFMFAGLFFLSLHCFSVFLLVFYMFFICLLILMTIIHHQVLLFFIFMLILTNMLITSKVMITPLQKVLSSLAELRNSTSRSLPYGLQSFLISVTWSWMHLVLSIYAYICG